MESQNLYHIHQLLSLFLTACHVNSFLKISYFYHNISSYFILLSIRRTSEWLFPSLISYQNFLHISVSLHACRSPCEMSRLLGTCNRSRFQKSNKISKLFRPGHVCVGHTCWPHITIYSNHVVSFAFRCCKCHVVHK